MAWPPCPRDGGQRGGRGRQDYLTGATDVELDTFDDLFGGSLPWLNEFF